MHILVTGGSGFIGTHTCKALLELGHTVRVFDEREPSPGLEVDYVCGDVSVNDATFDRAFIGIDSVIHLAARVSVRESVNNPAFTSMTNLMGMINALSLSVKHGVDQFTYASSAAVYGDPGGICREDISRKDLDPLSPYGLDKLTNEAYAAMFSDLYGIQCTGLRYFNVYGSGQDPNSEYAGVISKFIKAAKENQQITIFGSGNQTRNFVNVRDVARVNVLAAIGEVDHDIMNVAAPSRCYSINQLVEIIEDVIGHSLDKQYVLADTTDIRHSTPSLLRVAEYIGNDSICLKDGLTELFS